MDVKEVKKANKVSILNSDQIMHKLKRMAYEIWEKNSLEKEIVLIGIKGGGSVVAQNLKETLERISPLKISFFEIELDKDNPKSMDYTLPESVNKKVVVVVDDVANSGKTLLYAIKPLLDLEPKKIQIAVLVDRRHKSFPVLPDFIGHSVYTTIQDHIKVTHKNNQITGAYLE